ncbi:MAG: TAXI family TRAP transporter solute-binding subunit [Acidobacteria bacterium]|nr:TAXI family TRAP transporter solute-binding subunit [Acidobacteriota bacterium]
MFSRRRHAAVSRALLGLSIPLLAAGGCGGGGDGAPPAFLSLGTAPPGGAFFVVGGALAEVLGEAGLRVTPEATKGSGENIRRLASGELDFAVSNSAVTYFAARGEDGWGRAYPVQAVMTLAPNVATFVSPRRHEVNRIQDLAGRRVVVGVAGAGFEHFIRPIVEAHGVTYEDFIPLYNTQAGAVDMLSDDSAAAAIRGGPVTTASIVQATAGIDTLLLTLDLEIRSRLPEQYPFYREAVIPAGTYRGQDEDYLGLDVGSMHLITRADADEETVYQATRALWERRESVVEKHPAGRAINENNASRNTGVTFHPGAVRFYREAGMWPDP